MTTEQILKTIRYALPPDSPYYQPKADSIFGRNPLPLSTRLDIGLNDRKFPWNVAASYSEAGEMLPHAIYGDIRRAYYFAHGDAEDMELAHAHSLLLTQSQLRRHIIEGLLICQDIELRGIAAWTGVPLNVITTFGKMFFNIRDRSEDHSFIAGIAFPETRYATFRPDYQDIATPGQLLLATGYRYGAAEVLYLAGVTRERLDQASMQNRTKELEEGLMENAITLLRSGYANHADAQGIKHAKSLLIAEKNSDNSGQDGKRDDSVMGLGALSAGYAVIETMKGLQAEDIRKRIAMPEEPSPK